MTINGSTSSQYWSFKLEVTETGTSIVNNTSTLVVEAFIGRPYDSSYMAGASISCPISVTGTSQQVLQYYTDYVSVPGGGWISIGSKTFTVPHDADGNKTVNISASFTNDVSPSSGSASGNMTLTYIPRYATITQSFSMKTETSIAMDWTSDNTVDYVWYSLNNGSTWNALGSVNTTRGGYNVPGLTPNTTYYVKTRVRRKDSQLTSDSTALAVSTYAYPYITNIGSPNLVIGNSQTLTLYNPLSRSVSITMKKGSTTLHTASSSSTSVTFTPNANTLYESIPDKQSESCTYNVIYGNNTATSNGTYSVNAETNSPTFSNFTYEDTNATTSALTGDNQLLIKNKSTLQITISSANKMVAKNYASGSRYDIACGNRTASVQYSSSESVSNNLGTIAYSGLVACVVKAVDSRGLSTNVSKNITIIDYAEPSIVASALRINNFETSTIVSCSGIFSEVKVNNVAKNTITSAKFRYKKIDDDNYGSWTTFNVSTNNNTYTTDDKTVLLNNTDTYIVQFQVEDELSTSTTTTIVNEGVPIQYISSTHKNVGIGIDNEHEDYSLEVVDNIYADKNIICNNDIQIDGKVENTLIVEDIESKNLFNINNMIDGTAYSVSNNILYIEYRAGQGGYAVGNKIKNKYNNYTISYLNYSTSVYTRFFIRAYNISGTIISDLTIEGLTYNSYYKGYFKDNTESPVEFSFSLPSSVDTFAIGFVNMLASGNHAYSNIQVEKGDTKTDYNNFIDFNNIALDIFKTQTVETGYLGNNPTINNYKTRNGIYGIYGCTQAPSTAIGVLEVLVYSSDWVVQRFTTIGSTSGMWTRCYYSGTTWSSWVQRW